MSYSQQVLWSPGSAPTPGFLCCRQLVVQLQVEYPQAPLFAVGWSLGANILLRYLGEEGAQARLTGAVSLCNPFDLVSLLSASDAKMIYTVHIM